MSNRELRSAVHEMDYVIHHSRNFFMGRQESRDFRAFVYRAARNGADLNECSIGEWAHRFQAIG